jgi:hypothetical protein
VIYQHPLAYLIGMQGVALLRAWGGEYDEQFVRARLDEVRLLVQDETLTQHPGVFVEPGATANAYRQWAATYNDPGNDLLGLDLPIIDRILDDLPIGVDRSAASGYDSKKGRTRSLGRPMMARAPLIRTGRCISRGCATSRSATASGVT